jgi:hypothetical protein
LLGPGITKKRIYRDMVSQRLKNSDVGKSNGVGISVQNKYPFYGLKFHKTKVMNEVRLLEINWPVHSLVQDL